MLNIVDMKHNNYGIICNPFTENELLSASQKIAILVNISGNKFFPESGNRVDSRISLFDYFPFASDVNKE